MANLDLQQVENQELDLQPVSTPVSKPKFIPGTIRYSTEDETPMTIGPHEPTFLESTKSVLFPKEVGYGVRPRPVPREERLFRAIEFIPRTFLTGVSGAISRANIAATGFVKPLFSTVGKGRFERLELEELKKYPESVTAGIKAAFRAPGTEAQAPKYGRMLAEEWYEPLVGKEPPPWFEEVQNLAFEITGLFGPKGLRQYKTVKARKEFFAKVKKITTKYDKAVQAAKDTGDPRLSITIKKLREAERSELLPLVQSKVVKLSKMPSEKLAKQMYKEIGAGAEVSKKTGEIEEPVEKLTRLIKGSKVISKAKIRAQSKARKPKVAAFARELEKGKGDIAFKRAYTKLRGPLTEEGAFVAPRHNMNSAEMTSLIDRLRTTKRLQPLEKGVAWEGLHELFTGNLPQPHKLKLLEREFGKELVKAALSKRDLFSKIQGGFVDVLNLPRTILTSYDLSASLRQNMLAGVRHPKQWSKAFVAQLKAFGSEKNAIGINDAIRGSKWYKSASRNGLYLPDPTGISEVAATRPEEFMSRAARVFPGVKASERAFVTMGNKLRFELYSKYGELFTKQGIATETNMHQLAHYLNAATGRGDIGFLSSHGASLNALFFSPRYVASRFQAAAKSAQVVPSSAWHAITLGEEPINPVSKIAASDMVSFVTLNTSLLAAIKYYNRDNPDIDVEIDPRSSDFGKIRFGNTRIEAWAGYQPLARHIVQLLTGEKKATATARISDIERPKVVTRFARSKLAPVPAFVIDALTGESYVGDEVTLSKLTEVSTENLAYQRFFPLALQDIAEAAKHQSLGAGAIAAPSAILGLGVGSWEMTPGQELHLKQDEVARRTFGKAWDDTGPIAQSIMKNQNRQDWEQLQVKKKFEQKAFGSLEFVAREQKQAVKNITKNLDDGVLQNLNEIQIKVPSVSRRLGEWRMNDIRYKRYQNLFAENLNLRLSQEIKTESWKNSNVKVRRNIVNNIINQSKNLARNIVKMESNNEDFK